MTVRDGLTRARSTDPETSHAAAAAQAPKLTPSQARVLAMFRMYGDMIDRELVERVNDAERQAGFVKVMSPSGVRSRRSELSKPNEERLAELRKKWYETAYAPIDFGSVNITDEVRAAAEAWSREELHSEGFRSPLWDTGCRVKVGGYQHIVWGLAWGEAV